MDKKTKNEMETVEILIGKIMRIGVLIAASVMVIGFIMLVCQQSSGYPGTTFPTTLSEILKGITTFKPYAYMMAGIFLIILTPVLRVLVSIYAFYKEKDVLYVWITTIVFIILMFGFILGHH